MPRAPARPTISDVASEAGVSKGTVSAVLNGKPTVKESTRKRVADVIARLNYRPSGPARLRVAGPHRRSIGLVIKEMDNPYYIEVAAGALARGREAGYTVIVTSSEGDHALERTAVELLVERGVDGLIITPVLGDDADLSHLFELTRRNVPFVLLESITGVPASLIDVDNEEAMREVVRTLIDAGHTRIVHFAGPPYSMHSRERIRGMERAFGASPLAFSDAMVRPAGAHLEDGYRAGMAAFRGVAASRRPTAVTCYNDLVALGLLRALDELGLRVPEDVSVVGFDDLALLDYMSPGLSSVHVPKEEMGARAAELLIRHIEARKRIAPVRVRLESRFIARRSVARCPAPAASRGARKRA